MGTVIKIDVKSCNECPLHKNDRVYTPDSFEIVQGIYCRETEEENLVFSYDQSDRERIADIPMWCPFIIAQYKEIIDDFSGRRNYTHNRRISDSAISFLEALGNSNFDSVSYPLFRNSVERDQCLIDIALFEDRKGKKADVINGLEFFNSEDPEIIREARKFLSGKIGYEELFKRCEDPKNKPNGSLLMNTEIAVPLAIILSKEMNECFCTSFSLFEGSRKLTFVERKNKAGSSSIKEAELHFDGFLINLRKPTQSMWNETEKHIKTIEEILNRTLGVKKLKLYVGDDLLKRPREKKT